MKEIIKSFTYGENIQEKTAVKFSQEGVVVKAESQNDNVCGITLFTGKQGVKGDVMLFGLGLVATQGAVNAGDLLVPTENGKLKALNINEMDENATVVARVLESASSDAHLSAFINPQLVIAQAQVDTEEE